MRDAHGRLFVHAVNIHLGGGKRLLLAVLEGLRSRPSLLLLDARLKFNGHLFPNQKCLHFRPLLISRLRAELFLKKAAAAKDHVLCFGNLPPLFKLKAKVTLFLQNRYLVERAPLNDFPIRVRLRIHLERAWFRLRIKNVEQIFVQTPSMKRDLEKVLNRKIEIKVFPFIEKKVQSEMNNPTRPYDLLYVASGEPHKNHRRLIEALVFLAKEGIFPHLCLTISNKDSPQLCSWIEEQMQLWKIRVTLWRPEEGRSDMEEVLGLYSRSKALIFPSRLESMGLPLIEAQQRHLPIIAAEMDYVRDLVVPQETFDPDSEVSIARAIKRFLKIGEIPLALNGAEEFLGKVMEYSSSHHEW